MDKNDKRYRTAEQILEKVSGVEPISSELIEDGMLYREFV